MEYDLIIIGGGLGGASLARAMAERGARVLILEREPHFRDRVRGEALLPWGVTEARSLGIEEVLRASCGREVRQWCSGATEPRVRDMAATTPHGVGFLNFEHTEMQETLIGAAAAAGAEVRRGVGVLQVIPGEPPTVVLAEPGGETVELRARLVVGADGRTSRVRGWGGFRVEHDPEMLVAAGVLLRSVDLPEDQNRIVTNPAIGQAALVFPVGSDRYRVYCIYRSDSRPRRLSGQAQLPDFLAACAEAGALAEWFSQAEIAGPLASYITADTWVEHPYRAGVALVGDAAAASDPTFGCGLALTLRDVRVLRDRLLANDDWDAAGHAYATEHDGYYGSLRRQEEWARQLFYTVGPEADERRARVFPLLAAESERAPDMLGRGPEGPNDAEVLRYFS
ncbi:MAG: FAD-dependent monooxygenase [Chloroflexia bacterium]